MKKLIISLLITISFSLCFAQNTAFNANRNTATRCLQLAESCLVAGDWENALRQAELALAYDDSISDLIYIKAAAMCNLGYKKAEILPVIAKAFDVNDWLNYSTNGARILYADLLCDTGFYNESLDVLDQEPFIFSADAEFIRIKNYYRIGTPAMLSKAREKVNSARRVYHSDSRFPKIFFMFETMFKNFSELNNLTYEMPQEVRIIADSYIVKLPDYTNAEQDLEVYASFLASPEVQERLVRAISAKTSNVTPLLVIAQKKINMISDMQAFEEFFASCNDSISQFYLDLFISLITDDEVKQLIIEKFTNWDGTLFIDENLDLQNEVTVQYSYGRPKYISYDSNNDDVIEVAANCDFGAPVAVFYENDAPFELYYDIFPNVSKVNFVEKDWSFKFLHDDYQFSPFDMNLDSRLQELGIEFYVPAVTKDIAGPGLKDLILQAASYELPIEEREGARIVYTNYNGQIVFANFFEKDVNYAYCDFTTGFPFVRYVDYDNDGQFETSETFDFIDENFIQLESEQEFITKVFNQFIDPQQVYLKKVQIDRNSNTIYEFTEEYLSAGGRITTWDNDDNGIPDSQFIHHPGLMGDPVIEETIFYETNGLPIVSLFTLDGIPMKMNYNQEEVMIYSGEHTNFYWIEERQDALIENEVLRFASKGITQGLIEMFEYDNSRYSIIRIGNDYFCKKIPVMEIEE